MTINVPLHDGRLTSALETFPFDSGIIACRRTAATLLLFGVLLTAGLHGQTTTTASVALTLKDAVALALKQNIDIQATTLDMAAQQQEKSIARSTLLPHATLGASEAVNRFNLKAQLGLQLPDLPANIGPFQSIHSGASFRIPVFDLALLRKYQASGHRLEASRHNVQAVREQIILLTVSEYSAHLRALASVATAQSRVDLATRLLNQARDLWKDGVATKIDVSRADVRLSEEKQKLVDAQTDQQTTDFALKRILNLPDQTRLTFTDDKDFYSTPDITVDNSVAAALAKRPEIMALSAMAESAASERRAAVGQALPTLTAAGVWDEEGARFNGLAPGYEYHLELKIPIFTGGRLKAEREAARIAEHKSQLQLANERNRVTEQTRDGNVELQAALQQVQLTKQQTALANEELELAEGRFRAGVTDNIEVIAAQDAIARANEAQIAAFYRYSLARAELARAVGGSEQEYTQP